MHRKTLYILRHGKSDWVEAALADVDRPLKLRGVNAVRHNLSHILPEDKPDRIVTSHANRAVHTAILAAVSMGVPTKSIIIDERLYLTDYAYLDQYVKNTKNKYSSLMMVGHNPGYTDWVNKYLAVPLDNLPTAGLATFVFDVESWEDISTNNLVEGKLHLPSK